MGSTGELVGQAGRPDSEGGPHRISDAMSDQQKTREVTLATAGAVVARAAPAIVAVVMIIVHGAALVGTC